MSKIESCQSGIVEMVCQAKGDNSWSKVLEDMLEDLGRVIVEDKVIDLESVPEEKSK